MLLFHQFKISKSHVHKLFGNRLQEPGNRLPVQKDIILNWFNFDKEILIKDFDAKL